MALSKTSFGLRLALDFWRLALWLCAFGICCASWFASSNFILRPKWSAITNHIWTIWSQLVSSKESCTLKIQASVPANVLRWLETLWKCDQWPWSSVHSSETNKDQQTGSSLKADTCRLIDVMRLDISGPCLTVQLSTNWQKASCYKAWLHYSVLILCIKTK